MKPGLFLRGMKISTCDTFLTLRGYFGILSGPCNLGLGLDWDMDLDSGLLTLLTSPSQDLSLKSYGHHHHPQLAGLSLSTTSLVNAFLIWFCRGLYTCLELPRSGALNTLFELLNTKTHGVVLEMLHSLSAHIGILLMFLLIQLHFIILPSPRAAPSIQ